MFLQSIWDELCEHRRKVTAVSMIIIFWVVCPITFNIGFPIYFFVHENLRTFCIIWWSTYAAWAFWSRNLPESGGWPLDSCRTCWPWPVLRDYFSHQIVKTAELSPERNYLIGSHPHGILHIGGALTFSGKVSGFNDIFPGITQTIVTLQGQFQWPYRRETLMFIGVNSCSAKSINYLLNNPTSGRAVAIVIGGLSEALIARPGKYDIKIKDRKGFVRQAIINGADLVPCYHFGEVDLFDQARGHDEKLLKNMQGRLRNIFGFIFPLLRGASVFGFGLSGLLPRQRPITSVIGAPIEVTRKEEPSEEEVDALHQKYCDALFDLFDKHKQRHGIPEDVRLNIY